MVTLAAVAAASPPPAEWVPAPAAALHGGDDDAFLDFVAGDFDGDGRDELVFLVEGADPPLRSWSGPLGSAGGPVPLALEGLSAGEPLALASADLTGDGVPDLVVGVPGAPQDVVPGEIRIHAGGPGGLGASPTLRFEGPPGVRNLGKGVAPAGDLDGDGVADLLVAHAFYPVWSWARGTGAGFEVHDDWALSGTFLAGDLDGDGFSDLVRLGRTPDVVELYPGGPGGPAAAPSWSADRAWPAAVLADVTGDGHPDLGLGADDRASVGWFSFAAGLPTAPARVDPGGAGERFPAGDLDGDGFGDWAERDAGFDLAARSGAPGGSRAAWTLASPWSDGTLLGSAVAGDFDGDGCGDLAFRSVSGWITGTSTYWGYPLYDTVADTELALFSCPLPPLPPASTTPTTPTTTGAADRAATTVAATGDPDPAGCGCGSTGAPGGAALLALGALSTRRRARPGQG